MAVVVAFGGRGGGAGHLGRVVDYDCFRFCAEGEVGSARGLGFGGGWAVVVVVVVWETHVPGCLVRDGAELVALFSQPAAGVLVVEVGRPGGGDRVFGGLRASGAIAGGDPVDYHRTEEDWISGSCQFAVCR